MLQAAAGTAQVFSAEPNMNPSLLTIWLVSGKCCSSYCFMSWKLQMQSGGLFATFPKDAKYTSCMLVQEAKNGRALSEGTVLCSQERTPIGRIEDTFGPVMSPLYALRWAGQGDMPATVAVGSAVFTTQKLAEYLLAEQLYTNVRLFLECSLSKKLNIYILMMH